MKISCGILLFRKTNKRIEFFLVRPGGPFYKKSENGIWCFPKGEKQENESEIVAAKREFKEETGIDILEEIYPLGKIKLRKGKTICAFYCEKDFDSLKMSSSYFEMEYPKNSGEQKKFLEIEEGGWFSLEEAIAKIQPKLIPFIEKILSILL